MDGSLATEPDQKEKDRQSESRLARGQQLVNMGIWDWNLERREYSWSDEMCHIFNLKPQQFPIRTGTFLNCIHPEDKQYVVRALGKALVAEQSYDIGYRIVWPDGSVRSVRDKATVTFDKTGRPIRMLGTVQDITILKQPE